MFYILCLSRFCPLEKKKICTNIGVCRFYHQVWSSQTSVSSARIWRRKKNHCFKTTDYSDVMLTCWMKWSMLYNCLSVCLWMPCFCLFFPPPVATVSKVLTSCHGPHHCEKVQTSCCLNWNTCSNWDCVFNTQWLVLVVQRSSRTYIDQWTALM